MGNYSVKATARNEALFKEDLDLTAQTLDCGNPTCKADHVNMRFTNDCHATASIVVFYRRGSGLLSLRCSKCKRLLLTIQVESRDQMVLIA